MGQLLVVKAVKKRGYRILPVEAKAALDASGGIRYKAVDQLVKQAKNEEEDSSDSGGDATDEEASVVKVMAGEGYLCSPEEAQAALDDNGGNRWDAMAQLLVVKAMKMEGHSISLKEAKAALDANGGDLDLAMGQLLEEAQDGAAAASAAVTDAGTAQSIEATPAGMPAAAE